MTNKIEVVNLNFYYGNYQSLKNINLVVRKNHITAFMGHSGSGKSTLLRTFNRIYSLYPHYKAEGKIYLDGQNILTPNQDLLILRKKVGMVFQSPTPFPMSIEDNVSYGVKLYEKLKPSDLHDRVEWALKKAALWNEVKEKLKKSSLALSLGQQQRLCIARAIAVKPEVILLDEPTSSLDPRSSSMIEQLLLELKNDYTIVIVTHNLKQAKKVSDYTAHIHDGELIEFEATPLLFENPSSPITKEYIQEY